MSHFDEVFDIGLDYGADGGLGWDTQIVQRAGGGSRRNQLRSNALGQWQLGNRNVSADDWNYIQGFLHAMRGRLHSFLYKDWNDYRAVQEPLVYAGGATVQLIKTYGLSINGWIRTIEKPNADGFVLEVNVGGGGGGFAVVDPGDYTLDASTGIVTLSPALDTSDELRWSGEFYVRARFDRDQPSAQFLGMEDRSDGPKFAYAIGDLLVVEEPEEDG